jgi:hypothetical protein
MNDMAKGDPEINQRDPKAKSTKKGQKNKN